MVASIMRALADFGDSAGWLVAAIVMFFAAKRIVRHNDEAHAELGKGLAEVKTDVQKIAVDVAVLRDRSDRELTD